VLGREPAACPAEARTSATSFSLSFSYKEDWQRKLLVHKKTVLKSGFLLIHKLGFIKGTAVFESSVV